MNNLKSSLRASIKLIAENPATVDIFDKFSWMLASEFHNLLWKYFWIRIWLNKIISARI